MNFNGKRLLAFAGAFLGALAFGAAPTLAQPVSSHLGQKINEHVMLIDVFGPPNNFCSTVSFTDREFHRVFPDGTRDPIPFDVPAGRLLVLTDVEWNAYGGPNGTNILSANSTLVFQLAVGNNVVMSSYVPLDADSANGRPGKSEHMTTGIVVAPGARICPIAGQVQPSSVAASFLDRVFLRGYTINRLKSMNPQ